MAPDDAVIPIEDVIHLDQVEETAHMKDPEDQGIDIQVFIQNSPSRTCNLRT